MTHMVAVHERCGTDVEIIPSSQWYIDVLSEKERFLEAADEIRWHPAHMKSRYLSWVENFEMGLVHFQAALFRGAVPCLVLQKAVRSLYLQRKTGCR